MSCSALDKLRDIAGRGGHELILLSLNPPTVLAPEAIYFACLHSLFGLITEIRNTTIFNIYY